MPRDAPTPAGEVLVRYGAAEMPTATLERVQHDTAVQFDTGEIDARDAFRITNILLAIAVMKLKAVA